MYKWVTDSVVMAENEHGSNIFCVALSDELLFIDAGMLHGYTSSFREAMEKHYGLETSILYISHAHIDHILAWCSGNVLLIPMSVPKMILSS